MKCFFDSNVIIDALTDREGSVLDERCLLYGAVIGEIEGVLSSKQMTDIYYVLRKYVSEDKTRRELLSILLQGFEIVNVDKPLLSNALSSEVADFEDAVILESAKKAGASLIVTNDTKGFHCCGMDVKTPAEAMEILGIGED